MGHNEGSPSSSDEELPDSMGHDEAFWNSWNPGDGSEALEVALSNLVLGPNPPIDRLLWWLNEAELKASASPGAASCPSPLFESSMDDARHLYMFYGNPGSWPYLKAEDSTPAVLLARALNSAPLTRKTYLTLVDPELELDMKEIKHAEKGDILIFPDRVKYSGFDSLDVDFEKFVNDVLIDGKAWTGRKELPHGASYMFVCCEESQMRKCFVCGPALVQSFRKELSLENLADRVFCFSSSHPVHIEEFRSELVLYSGVDLKEYWYTKLSPADAQPILSSQFGILPRMAVPHFNTFWKEFNQAVEYTAEAKILVDTYEEFFSTSAQGNRKGQEFNKVILGRHVDDIRTSFERSMVLARICQDALLFDWKRILAKELNILLVSLFKVVRKLRKKINDHMELEGQPLSDTTKAELNSTAVDIRMLLRTGESLKSYIERVDCKAQPEAKILRESIHGFPILLPEHVVKTGDTGMTRILSQKEVEMGLHSWHRQNFPTSYKERYGDEEIGQPFRKWYEDPSH